MCSLIARSIIVTIYNIFGEERSKYIRILRLSGATKKDLYAMSNKESLLIFTYCGVGYLMSIIALLVYFRFNISIPLTSGSFIFISVVMLSAIFSALRKQMHQLFLSDNLTRSKIGVLGTEKKKIKTYQKSRLMYFDFGYRNIKIYRKKNKLINRSIVISSMVFIIVSTLFLSINYEKQISVSYKYNEDIYVYPKLQNMNQQLIDFQENNIIDEELIERIESIEGVENVIINQLMYVDIFDVKGNHYNASVQLNNKWLSEILEQYRVEGEVKEDKLVVNKWRMIGKGLNYNVGDSLNFKSIDGKYNDEIIIGGIINSYNTGELLFLPSTVSTAENTNYSISIITSSKNDNSFIASKLKELLQDYPILQLKSYETDLEDLKKMFDGFMIIIQIIVALFLLISVLNLINVINMDLLSRNKEFVLYEVNGMTRKQLRKVLFIEYSFIVIRAILIIFILSYLISYLIEWVVEVFMRIGYLDFSYAYHSFVIIGVVLIAVIITLILQETQKKIELIFFLIINNLTFLRDKRNDYKFVTFILYFFLLGDNQS